MRMQDYIVSNVHDFSELPMETFWSIDAGSVANISYSCLKKLQSLSYLLNLPLLVDNMRLISISNGVNLGNQFASTIVFVLPYKLGTLNFKQYLVISKIESGG